ncbi:group II intron reverse transcriptase/maturase [Nonomuraea sp. 3N208]|uniref:group II intron reverse transcriptase/maturase n=1 Tax=Nonomuraea sp. 3N208 TaxID=3457421 RepID=UPI003FD4DFFF
MNFDDHTIISTYGAEYRGIDQYYLLAGDVYRLNRLHWVMQTSLLKTLAAKHRSMVSAMARKYKDKTKRAVVLFRRCQCAEDACWLCKEELREIQQVHLAAADHPVVPVAETPARDTATRDGDRTDPVTIGVERVAHGDVEVLFVAVTVALADHDAGRGVIPVLAAVRDEMLRTAAAAYALRCVLL